MQPPSPSPEGPILHAVSAAQLLSGAPAPDGPSVTVRYFTDPLSAWCWGLEPAWLRLQELYGPQLAVDYRMTGLLRNLDELEAPGAAFHRPDQMAMQWEEVAHFTGQPLDSSLWLARPPASSWPACAAVKAAQRQDLHRGEKLLRRLREAVLIEGLDLTDPTLLETAAKDVGLDLERFADDLASGAAGEALEADLLLAAGIGAVTTPTLHFEGPGGTFAVEGAQPFEVLEEAFVRAHGDPAPVRYAPDAPERRAYLAALVESRGSVTATEIGVLLELDRHDADDLLERLTAAGSLRRVRTGAGVLYRAP